MTSGTKTLAELVTLYKVKEPKKNRFQDEGIRLLEQYGLEGGGFRRLKQQLPPLRASLTGLSDSEATSRAVPTPRNSGDSALIKLVYDVARSDGAFKQLSEKQLCASPSLGVWLREARLRGVDIEGSLVDLANVKAQVMESEAWGEEAVSEGDELEVEMVVDEDAREEGNVLYLVKWVGHHDLTWEPEENLGHCGEALDEFKEKRAQRAKRGGRGAAKTRTAAPAKKAGATRRGAASVFNRLGKGTKRKAAHYEDDPEGEGGDGDDYEDEVVKGDDKLASVLESLAAGQERMVASVGGLARCMREDRGYDYEDEEHPGGRAKPLLGGDKRMEEVGGAHFRKERQLSRERRRTKMQPNEPYAEKYNAVLEKLIKLEEVMLDADLVMQKQQGKQRGDKGYMQPAEVAKMQGYIAVHEERWMEQSDKLEFLQGLSTMHQEGKADLARQMYLDQKEAKRGQGAVNREFEKRKKMAQKHLKEAGERDRDALAARQLGLGSARWEGAGHRESDECAYGRAPQTVQRSSGRQVAGSG